MICVAVICLLGIIMRLTHFNSGRYLGEEEYKITFTASGLTENEVRGIKVGAALKTDKDAYFGTLAEGYWTEPENGADTFALTASAVCRGTLTETGILTGGYLYLKGDTAVVESGDLKLTVTIVGYEKTE